MLVGLYKDDDDNEIALDKEVPEVLVHLSYKKAGIGQTNIWAHAPPHQCSSSTVLVEMEERHTSDQTSRAGKAGNASSRTGASIPQSLRLELLVRFSGGS